MSASDRTPIRSWPLWPWLAATGPGWLLIFAAAMPDSTHAQAVLGAALGGALVAKETMLFIASADGDGEAG